LVFDGLDGSLGDPIDGGGFNGNVVGGFGDGSFISKIDGSEFFIGQIREKVDSFGIGLGGIGVVGGNFLFG
jgi:hypothetical protein